MPLVFCYSWLLLHVFSWMRKWDFWISELVSSVWPWSWILVMMHLSTVDCSTYLLGCLLWTYVCQVLCNKYLCRKYFVDFHVRVYLDCLLGCMWVVACVMSWCTGWIIWFVCVSFSLSENEWHNRYVFDFPMGVIKNFDGDDVWIFIFIPMIYIDNGGRLMAGLTVRALWQALSKFCFSTILRVFQ